MRLNLTFSLRRVSTGVGSAHAAATARARPARAPRGGSGNVFVIIMLFYFFKLLSAEQATAARTGERRGLI